MIDGQALAAALKEFFPRQRWFAAQEAPVASVSVRRMETMKSKWPALVRVEAEVQFQDGSNDFYQILLGLRRPGSGPDLLGGGQVDAVGDFDSTQGRCWAYDALTDTFLALELLGLVAPVAEGEANTVRSMGAEQSHTSLVFDNRLVLKVFRRLVQGRNPEMEVTNGLAAAGFKHIAELVAEWRSDDFDLGLIQRFLKGGSEGRALAATSIRDYYASGGDPAEAGGDFRAEAERLGQMTGEMHIALAEAFGTGPGDPAEWSELMHKQLSRHPHPRLETAEIARVFDELRKVPDPGPAIRVHGDFHLGQVMRTDAGWFVFDFEGEPARPLEERRMPSSPLKDVAGMLRSFHYSAWTLLFEKARRDSSRLNAGSTLGGFSTWGGGDDSAPPGYEDLVRMANAWVERARQAFIDGYVAAAHQQTGMLPSDTASFDLVLKAFELDKGVYEVGYEMAHRPEWVEIPLAALPQRNEA